MNLNKFNDKLVLLANLGVIFGIVFLAFELRQTNELMESERRYNRLQVVMQGNSPYVDSPLLNEAFRKATFGEPLNDNESIALTFQMINIFSAWQWTWIELGGTDEFPLAQYQDAMRDSLFLREMWEERKQVLMPEFVQFVDENIVPR